MDSLGFSAMHFIIFPDLPDNNVVLNLNAVRRKEPMAIIYDGGVCACHIEYLHEPQIRRLK